MEIIDLGLNFYIIHDMTEDVRTKIITTKPWRLGAHPLLIRSQVLYFRVDKELPAMVTTVWINISHLPIEQHNPETLIALGNLLGKTIALNARSLNKASQVHICIETDLNYSLPSQIMANLRKYIVNYEILHIFYSLFSPPLLHNRHKHMALRWPENPINSAFQNSNLSSHSLMNIQEINFSRDLSPLVLPTLPPAFNSEVT